MSKRIRELAVDRAMADGCLPRFGDLIQSGASVVGFFVRGVRMNAGRPDAGPWFQLTDGRGTFWLADPSACCLVRRQRLSLAQIGILAAAASRRSPDLVIGDPILRGDAPEDDTAGKWRPALDAEVADLLERKPPLVDVGATGEIVLTPAGRLAVELMSEVEQAEIARRFVGVVRQAAAKMGRPASAGANRDRGGDV